MRTLICVLLSLFVIALLARAVLSWISVRPGTALATLRTALYTVTEPVIGPIRRVIPPVRAGTIHFDLSFILVIVVISFVLRPLIC